MFKFLTMTNKNFLLSRVQWLNRMAFKINIILKSKQSKSHFKNCIKIFQIDLVKSFDLLNRYLNIFNYLKVWRETSTRLQLIWYKSEPSYANLKFVLTKNPECNRIIIFEHYCISIMGFVSIFAETRDCFW
jgi:hypothetical protein